jgi:hypothetical protein
MRKKNGYWTYDTCKTVASKFTAVKDFRRECCSAYSTACRNGWLNDYDWLEKGKNRGYWTYERCYEEAKKCSYVTEFAKRCPSGHHRAAKNGWIKDYDWFVNGREISAQKNTIWNYEACYELAKQCRKKTELCAMSERAYDVARKNGWFADYTWFLSDEEIRHQKRPSKAKWPYEVCRKLASQYSTLRDFMKKYPSAYNVANKNGWMDDFDWLERARDVYTVKTDNVYAYYFNEFKAVYIGRSITPSRRDIAHNTNEKSAVFRFASENSIPVPKMTILESGLTITEGLDREDFYRNKYQEEGWNVLNIAKTGKKSGSIGSLGSGKWNYNSCYKEAQKYHTLKDFRKKSPTAYIAALKNGWKNEYTWLETINHKPGYWTYERCYEEAKKYKTRKQFAVGSPSAYDRASKAKWLNKYVWIAPPSNKFKWDYNGCYNEAKKYTKYSEFRKHADRAEQVARKNGWLKDFVWLEKKDISQKPVLQYSLDGEFIARYNGVREAQKVNGFKTNSGISMCCKGKLKKHQGFIWKYE